MIDVIKSTPQIYSKKSRDYQLISRLYSTVFNLSKMYADGMHIWEQDIDNKLATLRAKTLNLETKYSWSLDDLEALTTCFKYLIKIKGTKKVLVDSLNLILKSENYTATVSEKDIELDDYDNLIITLRHKLESIDIIDDLIRLFMPAGIGYRIIYKDQPTASGKYNSDVFITDELDLEHKIEHSLTDTSYIQRFIGDNTECTTDPRYITTTYVYDDNKDIVETTTRRGAKKK